VFFSPSDQPRLKTTVSYLTITLRTGDNDASQIHIKIGFSNSVTQLGKQVKIEAVHRFRAIKSENKDAVIRFSFSNISAMLFSFRSVR